ncbi:UDP-glucuronosyltransferase 2a1-like [Plakobranchus ocellatus]|uniref:UDP-glucuronosyltransferase 2a1-like n=1 Tax=Plakobranchus ocellatus TaxID=259542 RepID=A0AAV4A6X8_9GAST|nr:UDP-glucuronosyltransferase 2a1-like [Plakobranchus ocellatus]
MDGLATWLGTGKVLDTLAAVKDRDLWRDMIANALQARHLMMMRKLLVKRQATFLGHVMRRGKLEHLVTTGKFEGKRSRGRQREKIMDGLATWLGPGKVSDILAAVKDRNLRRDMIANTYKQGT